MQTLTAKASHLSDTARQISDSEYLLSLPEDPEQQFVAFERRLRDEMWARIHDESTWSYIQDQKIYYVTKLMAIHDAYSFTMLKKPPVLRRSDDFDRIFDEFMDEVTYWTTQIEVRQAQRLRPISTILRLTEDMKRQIHSYINKIREIIVPIDLSPAKKEALLAKLNALADEVDRDRTKTEAWTALVLEIASVGGKAADELTPVRSLADAIGNLFGKAKELAEALRLPSPGERKRIEPPAPVRDERPEPSSSSVLDDDIPF